ncbi:AbrB/MazE/SpoVT family DNA-binding domain-containing protein [Adlercreutzia sp. ZJ242]|uniref:AbrB/MazE/SpoVT family DNA-binding domain-containing protein n=1 Tax=Adlercreutzia sp. ZJ242 TaxID=2709409 RepID=UPI0013EAB36B|nr:AbrB/MazE/SpoVT family DNA-binding domain-containing protein [Adlercreutzia sp. ZJ242]
MCMTTAAQRTRISSWGNSEAVRIPKGILKAAGLSAGDDVDVAVNERGNIELVPKERAHRRVRPARHVTYESLFAGYEGDARADSACAWPDAMAGAEGRAWGL